MNKIVIYNDRLEVGEVILYPPFIKKEVDSIIGNPRECDNVKLPNGKRIYAWDSIGISGYYNPEKEVYDTFVIATEENLRNFPYDVFKGEILVDDTVYTECEWKYFSPISLQLKQGCFELHTLFKKDVDKVPAKIRELANSASAKVEITYVGLPKSEYELVNRNIKEVTVSDFNFKLAIIQELMYEKKVLQPKFNYVEFCKQYTKRDINILEEGFNPIQEIVEWFEQLQIPIEMADEIDEIYMDGGNDIYHQIFPLWDGEDDYFDIRNVSPEELAQFKNLTKVTLMTNEYERISKVFENKGIIVSRL